MAVRLSDIAADIQAIVMTSISLELLLYDGHERPLIGS